MNLEEKIVQTIIAELKRQSEAGGGKLQIGGAQEGVVSVNGDINLEELAMAVAGAVSGGP